MSLPAKKRKTIKSWMPLDRKSSNKETKAWWMRLQSESLKLPWEKGKKKLLRTIESNWNKMSKYLLSVTQSKIKEEKAWLMKEKFKKFKNYWIKKLNWQMNSMVRCNTMQRKKKMMLKLSDSFRIKSKKKEGKAQLIKGLSENLSNWSMIRLVLLMNIREGKPHLRVKSEPFNKNLRRKETKV